MENNNFYSDSSGKIKIIYSNLITFLQDEGYKMMVMNYGEPQLVRIMNNSIIKIARNDDMMQTVKNKLLEIDRKPQVWDEFLKGDYINMKTKMALTPITDLKINIANIDTTYFFFKNGVLQTFALMALSLIKMKISVSALAKSLFT